MCEASGSRCDKWLAMSKTFKHNDGDVRIFEENSTGANLKQVSLAMLCLANEVEGRGVRNKRQTMSLAFV